MRRIVPLAFAALLATMMMPASGGPSDPLVLRTVTIGQTTALAYYSPIEGGFRFVGGAPVRRAGYEASNTRTVSATR